MFTQVLPAVNERLDGSDPEIGPCVPLTTAALAAQENALDVSYQAMEGGREPTAGLSESFERTSQSQMLQRYLRELAAMEVEEPARATASEPFLHTSASKALSTASEARHLKHSRQTVALPTTVVTERSPKRPRLEDRSKSKSVDDRQTRPQETRLPLGCISTAMTNAICKPPTSSSTMKRVNAKRIEESKSQAPTVPCVPARPAPKVKDFTFQIVGQQQISFQERLAAWQAREAEAAKLGKPMLQPLVLPARDPAKEARKADKPAVSRPKRPTQAKEFSWHSDKRAKERKDWEDRLREKEQILAELAEIKRLEAEAAELEAIRKMRAAQVPIAHPVPAFIRSKRRA